MTWELVRVGGALLTALLAVYIDRRWDFIPNWLTLSVLPAAIVAGIVVGDPWTPTLGLAVGLVIGVSAFATNHIQGGVAKLLFAVAALLGWRGVLIVSAVVLLRVLIHYGVEGARRRRIDDESDARLRATIPAAPAVALGVVLAGVIELWLHYR